MTNKVICVELLQTWIGEYELALDEEKQCELPNRASALERAAKRTVLRALVGVIDSGRLSPSPAPAEGWQPIETAPKDGKKFVALKVTIVDEYDDEYSRVIPVRENVEMVEPVLMQWVQFAKFIDGQFMEIPHKMYRNIVRYIGWAPIPEMQKLPPTPTTNTRAGM